MSLKRIGTKVFDIQLTEDGNYRPNKILVDNEIYTMDAFYEEHGYNWESSRSGNILYYRSETGREIRLSQKMLREMGETK